MPKKVLELHNWTTFMFKISFSIFFLMSKPERKKKSGSLFSFKLEVWFHGGERWAL